jgi:lipopolysaccharide/colanic/teichoic acid biosynthesis glycosyltransferase
MSKRAFDIIAALLGLTLLAPLLLLVALLIKLDSAGPIFFRQERMGKGFRPFRIYKFRTMVQDAPHKGGPITFGADPRITRLGRVLRRTKLDEFPQLLNVLRGEMSFVGPRPEVRPYVDLFREDYEEILRVVPGITDLASVQYRDEAEVLGRFADPEAAYVGHILPDKIKLAKEYVRRASLIFDITVILKTLTKLFHHIN